MGKSPSLSTLTLAPVGPLPVPRRPGDHKRWEPAEAASAVAKRPRTTKVPTTCTGAGAGAWERRDKEAHSLSFPSSLFPRFSSEPDRDRELMKGEVDG